MRQWDMLHLIPRHPSKISTTDLVQRLSAEGFNTTARTIQRDLTKLSATFPLICDDRDKPYGWSWRRGSDVMDVPGMDTHTALAFYLAKKYLGTMLPRESLKHLQPHFDMAGKVLNAIPTDTGIPVWRNKIRVLRRGQFLTPPTVQVEVQGTVYDALLLNRKIRVSYCGRNDSSAKEHELNPLGIILKDGLIYLVCTYWDYEEIKLLPLHRMKTAQRLDVPCQIPGGFNLDEYIDSGELDFAIGETIKLKVLFSSDAAFHLGERSLSDDQTVIEHSDGRMKITASVQDTSELRWWLLGFGDNVEVLEPKSLRDNFRDIVIGMTENYTD
ncbi:WYL domain-containing transcriptional regulator [Mariprofundus sp. EBB-1]|nr:WYL domain-containing transcriptional regulator [Mariprofundus sp. EBB-1]